MSRRTTHALPTFALTTRGPLGHAFFVMACTNGRPGRVGRVTTVAAVCLAVLHLATGAWGQPAPNLEEIRQELAQVLEALEEQRAAIADLRDAVERLEQASRGAQTRRGRQEAPRVVTVSTVDQPFKGRSDAPVTLVEFSDFQCPYCGRFFRDALPAVERDLIASGKVRFVYRHFPLPTHAHARAAAHAAVCAKRQGKFWEMHDWLFANQATLDASALARAGRDLGLDVVAYDACRDSADVKAEVESDVRDGVKAGVRGTPAFVIGRTEPGGTVTGEMAIGVQSSDGLRAKVEALTAGAEAAGGATQPSRGR